MAASFENVKELCEYLTHFREWATVVVLDLDTWHRLLPQVISSCRGQAFIQQLKGHRPYFQITDPYGSKVYVVPSRCPADYSHNEITDLSDDEVFPDATKE